VYSTTFGPLARAPLAKFQHRILHPRAARTLSSHVHVQRRRWVSYFRPRRAIASRVREGLSASGSRRHAHDPGETIRGIIWHIRSTTHTRSLALSTATTTCERGAWDVAAKLTEASRLQTRRGMQSFPLAPRRSRLAPRMKIQAQARMRNGTVGSVQRCSSDGKRGRSIPSMCASARRRWRRLDQPPRPVLRGQRSRVSVP
jgi:hypothetical protein